MNAIAFLCMLKEHYVVGLCIAAYTHKCFIKKYDLNIKLVVMCDRNIYEKYHSVLKLYFDVIKKIKLIEYPLSNKFVFAKEKYGSWVSFCTNKWKMLKYTEYNKILFLDIDILPASHKFYDIFKLHTPAILRCWELPHIEHKCDEISTINPGESFDDYVMNNKKVGSLNASICLLTPSKKLYKKYKKVTKENFTNGIYSFKESFPDETSLFYTLTSTNKHIYNICKEYCVVFWDEKTEEKKKILSYNFASNVKPWIKGRTMCWDEELLWHDLYCKLPYSKTLDDLYNASIIDNFHNGFLKLDPFKQKKWYYIDKIEIDKITDTNINLKNNITNNKTYGMLKTDELGSFL